MSEKMTNWYKEFEDAIKDADMQDDFRYLAISIREAPDFSLSQKQTLLRKLRRKWITEFGQPTTVGQAEVLDLCKVRGGRRRKE